MKNQDTQKYLVIVVAAMLLTGAGVFFALGGGSASTVDEGQTGVVNVETGQLAGPWTNTLVNYKLITSDKYSGADVAATAKVYDDQPDEWLNARGDFDDSAEFTTYIASAGEVLINKEKPGMYYVVLTATGYNTEFMTIEIPDGSGRGDISDYQANPDSAPAELSLVGTTTVEHLEFALVNDTNSVEKETAILTIAENTEFRGWKVIVNDEEGFSYDTDGDGNYDEGIQRVELTVGSKSYKIFDPDNGVDEFDSNDEFTFELADVVADEDDLVIKVEIEADTSDSVGANDEAWGEGEGVLSYIKIYDAEGDIFANVQIVA